VDGSYTLDTQGMMNVLKSIGARLIIPMHILSNSTLERFLSLAREARQATEGSRIFESPRSTSMCDGVDDARRQEGERDETPDVTLDLVLASGDVVEGT
jgi:hypothetical protein